MRAPSASRLHKLGRSLLGSDLHPMPAPAGSPQHVPITLAVFAGAKASRPAAHDTFTTWAELTQELIAALTQREPEKDKRDCLAFGTYRLRMASDGRAAGRSDAAVLAHTAITIDVDGCEIEPILDTLDRIGWSALVYASASDPGESEPTRRRVRIIAPVDREILGSEIKSARHHFAEALGLKPGQGVERADASQQIFFIGRALSDKGTLIPNGDRPRDYWLTGGGGLLTESAPCPVPVDKLLSPPLTYTWTVTPAGAKPRPAPAASVGEVSIVPSDEGRVGALLAALGPHWQDPGVEVPGGRRQLLRALGGYLARWGWTDDELRAIAAGLPTARPQAEREELILEAAHQRRSTKGQASVTAGWATICGWDPKAARVIEAHAGSSFASKHAVQTLAKSVRSKGADGKDHQIILPQLAALDEGRDGPRPSRINVERVVQWIYGECLRYEESSGRITVDPSTPDPEQPGTTQAIINRLRSEWPALASVVGAPWQDHHTSELATLCEGLGLHVDTGRVWETVQRYAHARSYNVISEWAMACAEGWDQVPRIDRALATYFRIGDGDDGGRSRDLVSRLWFLSIAARALEPGCQCDTALVMQGNEGLGKTSAIFALVGKAWSASGRIALNDTAAAQGLRGKLLWEIGEGLGGHRSWDMWKQFLSQRVDTYRAPYERTFSDVPRQVCFVVTINDERFITDPKGARRFLPVTVTEMIDVAAIERDRGQLIGEAAARVLAGEQWHPTHEEALVLRASRGQYMTERDPWCDAVGAWLESGAGLKRIEVVKATPSKPSIRRIAALDLFHPTHGAIPMQIAGIARTDYLRLADVMSDLGWERKHFDVGWRYVQAVPG